MTDRSAKAEWVMPRVATRPLPGRLPETTRQSAKDGISRFLLAAGTVVICMILAWPFIPRRYEATSFVILHMSAEDDAQAGLRQGIVDEGAIQSEMDRLGSQHIARQAMERLGLEHDRDFATPGLLSTVLSVLGLGTPAQSEVAKTLEKLRDEITVARERRSYTMRVAVRDRDAERAAAIANAVVGAYLDDQIERKRALVTAATSRLSEREAALRASHQTALENVRSFMAETGITDRADGSELQGQLNTLSTEFAQARVHRIDARVRADALRAMAQAGTLPSAPEVVNSPSVQKAREALAAARARPAVLATEITSLTAAVDEEIRRVVAVAEREADAWRAREEALGTAVAGVRQEMVLRRLDELRLDELRRRTTAEEVALSDAVAKLKAQLGRDQSIQPDADVVARAERPRRPAFPNAILAALGTLLLAAMAGTLAATRFRVRDLMRSLSFERGNAKGAE